MDAQRLQRLLQRIDQLNREDPNAQLVEGRPVPSELWYAERLTVWVKRLDPQPSEALRIAARGQHVRRWTIPRDRYERGRRGYLRWREALKAFHIQTVSSLMREVGYAEEAIARVGRLMSKRDLPQDRDTQTLEDALCLVFLESQFANLRRKTPDETMRGVLRKTWQKMSEPARQAALALPLDPADRAVLERAVANE